MKNKLNVSLLSFFLVITLMSLTTAVLDTVAINSPSASSTISGTVQVNATLSSNLSHGYNCSFSVHSLALTGNTTWTNITGEYLVANESQGLFNTTFVSLNVIEDGNDYVFNATCTNVTDIIVDTNTGITIDNTVPIAPTTLSPASNSIDDDGTITFSGAVTNNVTTSCTLYFVTTNPGNPSYSMTYSGTSCSRAFTNVPETYYDYYIQASDETNTTNSAVTRFGVDIDTPSNYLFQEKSSKPTLTVVSDGETPKWIWGIVVLIVIGVIYFVSKK